MNSQRKKLLVNFNEVLNWLTSNEADLPQEFIEEKTKLNSIVPYIVEQLWYNLKIASYLNKHTNNLFSIPDPIEHLKLLKKIFKIHGIKRWNLWTYFPKREEDFIKKIEEQELYDEGNALARYIMIQKSNSNVLNKYQKKIPKKKDIKATSNVKELVKTVLEKESVEIPKGLPQIENLTQELIDELGLVLFNTYVLKKSNRVLTIFIDKENKKWFHLQPFQAKIYVSGIKSIIQNDYIETKDSDKFIEYIIPDVQLYTKLKFLLNSSYERVLNGGL
jgi:hypothetical protein